jgi:spore coat protein CotH
VELILNGVYEGSYVLTEQVQVGKGRVDIDEDAGFLVELDSYYDEDPKFTSTSSKLPVMIKSPEDLEDPAGYDFVKDSVNQLDNLLFAEDFPENGYRDLIDMDTFVKFLIINEVVGNSELSYPKSAYMYKDNDKDGKICLGPLWDFDGAFCYEGNGANVYFTNSIN